MAAFMAAVIGVGLGLAMAGGMRGRQLARVTLIAGASMPSFLLALLVLPPTSALWLEPE